MILRLLIAKKLQSQDLCGVIHKLQSHDLLRKKIEMHEGVQSIPLGAYYCIIEKKSEELLFLWKACK